MVQDSKYTARGDGDFTDYSDSDAEDTSKAVYSENVPLLLEDCDEEIAALFQKTSSPELSLEPSEKVNPFVHALRELAKEARQHKLALAMSAASEARLLPTNKTGLKCGYLPRGDGYYTEDSDSDGNYDFDSGVSTLDSPKLALKSPQRRGENKKKVLSPIKQSFEPCRLAKHPQGPQCHQQHHQPPRSTRRRISDEWADAEWQPSHSERNDQCIKNFSVAKFTCLKTKSYAFQKHQANLKIYCNDNSRNVELFNTNVKAEDFYESFNNTDKPNDHQKGFLRDDRYYYYNSNSGEDPAHKPKEVKLGDRIIPSRGRGAKKFVLKNECSEDEK